MINFRDFSHWIPDRISEDRVNLVLLQTINTEMWRLVYYNPPSGSWKGLSIYKDGYLYRQVGPKRGVARMKRPDVAFQEQEMTGDNPRFLLIESKVSRNSWDSELPALMQAYFEDQDEGVRRLPFDHRRSLDDDRGWESLQDSDASRHWFSNVSPTYLCGFAYGPIAVNELKDENSWMRIEISKYQELLEDRQVPAIPIFMVAIGFDENNLRPHLQRQYSENFPEDAHKFLEDHFNQATSPEGCIP